MSDNHLENDDFSFLEDIVDYRPSGLPEHSPFIDVDIPDQVEGDVSEAAIEHGFGNYPGTTVPISPSIP